MSDLDLSNKKMYIFASNLVQRSQLTRNKAKNSCYFLDFAVENLMILYQKPKIPTFKRNKTSFSVNGSLNFYMSVENSKYLFNIQKTVVFMIYVFLKGIYPSWF